MSTTFTKLNRTIGPAFNRAAPDEIRWAAESAFFEFQMRAVKTKISGAYHHVILHGLENNIEATIESVVGAARQVAAMGLTMNPTAKLVYFIPRRTRERYEGERASDFERDAPWIVDALPSYMGLCYIGTHYADARIFGACEVYKADKFVNRGPFQFPIHEPTRDSTQRDERSADGVYAACRMHSGDERVEYIDAPTIQRIRGLSKVPDSLMYTKVWTEGWKKIALRRLCKIVIQTQPRMLAAEEAMRRQEGFTFDNEGNVLTEPGPVDVPRGTGAQPAEKARGMAGLKTKIHEAHERAQEDAEREPGADDDKGAAPEKPALLALPAPSKHPEGSIEWFLDQVHGADSLERLDAVRAAALAARIDQGDDAPTFREGYKTRFRTLKAAPTGAQGKLV